jgi:hypothetical protein
MPVCPGDRIIARSFDCLASASGDAAAIYCILNLLKNTRLLFAN